VLSKLLAFVSPEFERLVSGANWKHPAVTLPCGRDVRP
jgi:hypothetical protein